MNDEQKKPYTSPRITRVVLRKEQAILSACSTSATTLTDNGGTNCIGGEGNCSKYSSGFIGKDMADAADSS